VNNTVVIVGAGFSAAAGIPLTSALLDAFPQSDPTPTTAAALQTEISRQLTKFWKMAFGWRDSSGCTPTFEDHFTLVDLAANTGHHIGWFYSPARLRAIRRLSLHRVFETLDVRFNPNPHIARLMKELADGQRNAIVSTNWDIVVERHLDRAGGTWQYGIPMESLDGVALNATGLEVLKLHGSANWCYCDDCRRVFANSAEEGKGAYKRRLFLEKRDFRALGISGFTTLDDWKAALQPPECPHCGVRLSARVATFSFQKALGFYQFQGVWEQALRHLRTADEWVFIGYSLPEADFELRQLIKTAQLGGWKRRKPKIDVVLQGSSVAERRFKQFFGSALTAFHDDGFDAWSTATFGPITQPRLVPGGTR
jgi:NAD-dependent SIR2 family protein deacetylase